MTDRENLEQLVELCLSLPTPVISISRGRELLGFEHMEEMREWLSAMISRNETPIDVNKPDITGIEMVQKKSWNEFRETGLLLFANQILHIFGWSLVVVVEENGEIKDSYPARVKFRGFTEETVSKAYLKISKYMRDHGRELCSELDDELMEKKEAAQ